MRRFSSIDFLRGLAMLIMIFLHALNDTLDVNGLTANMGNLTILELILLLVLPFLGGLAGFFLMISAIGNMISMQKQLKRGRNTKDLALRQIMGGILLLIFAMLCESLLGYHGYIGEIFGHLNNISSANVDVLLSGGYHFETIHTIAWCVIINGAVHAILSRNDGWKNTKKITKQYLILAAIVLVLTPLMWWLADVIVPGFPYGIDPITNKEIQYAVLGKSSVWDFIIRFLLAPLAAKWEPVFPYLAGSFIGSIIGIYLSQDKKDVDITFMKKFLKFGLVLFLIGAVGFIANLVVVIITVPQLLAETFDMAPTSDGIGLALRLYTQISEHRFWTMANGVPFLGWLFQFLLLNGFGICSIIMIIRLVEFRGKGKKFAEKTVFIRRLGFIAFTVYTIQYIYNFTRFIFSSIFATPYAPLTWVPTLLSIAMTFAIYFLITWAWEKVGYIGSMEWMIGTIAAYLIPGKKITDDRKWWQKGRLNVEGAFYNAEWLNIIEPEEINHDALSESRLAFKMSRLGFIFFPFHFVAYTAAKNALKTEKPNPYQKKAQTISLIGIILFFVCLILFLSIKLSTLGISF